MDNNATNGALARVWEAVLQSLETELNKPTFDSYIKNIRPLALQDGSLTIGVPSNFVKDWIVRRLGTTIENIAGQTLGQPVTLKYEIVPSDKPVPPPPPEEEPPVEVPTSVSQRAESWMRDEFSSTPLNRKYTFENFVIGRSNSFCHAAAVAVANAPARVYNPLFIYGGVGLGKTHLMQAIGHHVIRQNKAAEVVYVSGETFLFHVVTSIREDRMAEFRRMYRNVDIWLVDDIQYIAEAERTEVEFFHIFNSLYDTNKQIVICSDRPPKELQLIEGRLRSRFEWGLITHIEPPDLEHRIAILQKKARDENVDVPNEVLQFIAEKIKTNIRTLEGALTRLFALASLNNSRVTLELAIESLKHYSTGEEESVQVSINVVLQATCDHFQISNDELTGKKRNKEVLLPRQIGMYLAKEMTGCSFPEIGSAFGRDHSTVIHAYEKIKGEVRESREVRNAVNEIRTKSLVLHMNLDKKREQEDENL